MIVYKTHMGAKRTILTLPGSQQTSVPSARTSLGLQPPSRIVSSGEERTLRQVGEVQSEAGQMTSSNADPWPLPLPAARIALRRGKSRCAQGAARPTRPGTDHRRLRRRSERDRHLFAGRRAVRLRDVLGDAVLLPADGGDPGDQRAHGPRHRPGHRRQHPRALLALAALRDRRACCWWRTPSIWAPISARWPRR